MRPELRIYYHTLPELDPVDETVQDLTSSTQRNETD